MWEVGTTSCLPCPSSPIHRGYLGVDVTDWPGCHLFQVCKRQISHCLFQKSHLVLLNYIICTPQTDILKGFRLLCHLPSHDPEHSVSVTGGNRKRNKAPGRAKGELLFNKSTEIRAQTQTHYFQRPTLKGLQEALSQVSILRNSLLQEAGPPLLSGVAYHELGLPSPEKSTAACTSAKA